MRSVAAPKWACLLLSVLLAMTAASCAPETREAPPVSAALAARPAAIPPADVLTLATRADMAAAAEVASDPAIQKAIGEYLGSAVPEWNVVAARPIGDYVLLWVSFPDVMDGGVDLVYSRTEQRIGWEFKGGERG